jgi:HSP20 family protein
MATSLMRRNGVGSLNPWRWFDEMERQMWDWANTPTGFTPVSRLLGESRVYTPPADIYETNDDLLVAVSVPGIDPSKVNVQVHNGTLTVSGEQKPLVTPSQETPVTQHFAGTPRYGNFSFSFTLPCEVESERAEAIYQDGILRLRFPKAQAAKPVRISVNVQNTAPTIETSAPDQIEAKTVNRKKTQ